MDARFEAILLRFPEDKEVLLRHIGENEDFEALCFDYGLCINMLKALEKETRMRDSEIEEYIQIKVELEQEVLKYL
jgi:hypothetical protein